MSYTYLQEQGEESSAECFSDIAPFVLSRLNHTAEKSYSSGSGTESCPGSPSGTTCARLTEHPGGELQTSCAEASHAKILASQVKALESTGVEAVSGTRWQEWFAKWDRATSSWKTRQPCLFAEWEESSAIWPRWGTMLDGVSYHAETQGDFTLGSDSGFLLPTIGKNEFKGSGRDRFWGSPEFRGAKMAEGVRTSKDDPIYLSPSFSEEAMMWPVMWTALVPLETDRFQQWLRSHGIHSAKVSAEL